MPNHLHGILSSKTECKGDRVDRRDGGATLTNRARHRLALTQIGGGSIWAIIGQINPWLPNKSMNSVKPKVRRSGTEIIMTGSSETSGNWMASGYISRKSLALGGG